MKGAFPLIQPARASKRRADCSGIRLLLRDGRGLCILHGAEQARKRAEQNPGLRPECDSFGMPEGGRREEAYYPENENVDIRDDPSRRQPGATSADRKGGKPSEELGKDASLDRDEES